MFTKARNQHDFVPGKFGECLRCGRPRVALEHVDQLVREEVKKRDEADEEEHRRKGREFPRRSIV